MKRLFLIAALSVTTLFSLTAAATTGKDNPAVLQSFQNNFAAAQDVQWHITEDLYKATFTYNGQVVSAFYSPSGEQLALSRNITSAQLPLALQTGLKKQYGQYWISDLFEMTDNGGLSYYVTLENGSNKIVLKSEGSFNWATFQKTKKA